VRAAPHSYAIPSRPSRVTSRRRRRRAKLAKALDASEVAADGVASAWAEHALAVNSDARERAKLTRIGQRPDLDALRAWGQTPGMDALLADQAERAAAT
jgi:hypothetical protein